MRKNKFENKLEKKIILPTQIKKLIFSFLFFLISLIFALSFFEKAGIFGQFLIKGSLFLIGQTTFLLPLIFGIFGFLILNEKYREFIFSIILASLLLIFGISGIFGTLNQVKQQGGKIGQLLSFLFLRLFGFYLSQIIFFGLLITGFLIFWQILIPKREIEEKKPISQIFKIFSPKFKVKEIEPKEELKTPPLKLEKKPIEAPLQILEGYSPPPTELLESDKGAPTSGDIKINSAIIKKTLQNFEIPVEMSEINIGPTVTQYTLKPAEGVKLSKITALNNDLALALASHPIRIEAPIPGRALVGIEVPNKVRALVRLRNLIENSIFQNLSNLTFILGRDVSGNPIFADLGKMPHLLVAGSTGTGKTIFLNNLILSLLYKNSPQILRLILIDPKRVEFPIYNGLPHLLSPVISDPQRTINALKWLISEMERRFDIFSELKTRDILAYNKIAEKEELMPYIILIIDELADLMAARGREIEAGIVRLAQLSRAVGIHLVLATQRPSVEVITGLIKANITSRISFQVASQVDSRTVLDIAGAEKLLGLGDMLFISAEILKPKRIQGAFVSDKEVKKVVNWLKSKIEIPKNEIENELREELEKEIESDFEVFYKEEDPLYEEAKRVVIEARKASATLLQRRLRIGYARAARLIDSLEKNGIIGPANGAKPREVYIDKEDKFE